MRKTLVLTGAALLTCGLVLAYLGQAELTTTKANALGIVMLALGLIMAIGGAGLTAAGSLEYRRVEAA